MGYDWRSFLPSEVNEKENTKGSVIKEETDTVSTEKEDVKENDIANSKKLYEDLIYHISGEHNSTRLVLFCR